LGVFAAQLMRFEVVREGLMPIHLKHHDKNITTAQQLEISLVMPEEVPPSQVSYTALKTVFGVLYGSIETWLGGYHKHSNGG
jgi:hypothetical protein